MNREKKGQKWFRQLQRLQLWWWSMWRSALKKMPLTVAYTSRYWPYGCSWHPWCWCNADRYKCCRKMFCDFDNRLMFVSSCEWCRPRLTELTWEFVFNETVLLDGFVSWMVFDFFILKWDNHNARLQYVGLLGLVEAIHLYGTAGMSVCGRVCVCVCGEILRLTIEKWHTWHHVMLNFFSAREKGRNRRET